MINDDKRVLEHFNNLLDHTKDKEKLTINRQNIKYIVGKLERHFVLEHAHLKVLKTSEDRKLKINRQTKEINRLHKKIEALEQSHVDVVNEYKEKECNLNILNGSSDALYNAKHTTDILDAFNNIILGLFKLSDDQWVFNTINVNTDTIDQYKKIEKEIGMELHEIAGKIENMRNLIFAEVINWHRMSELFKALEDEE